jgi:hypothetical protein
MIYQSFVAFMESVVIPQKAANPSHIRLDGETSGGNRTVAGEFRHHSKVWKIHADTRYEPLMLAYSSTIEGRTDDPFKEESTRNGNCLVLNDIVRRRTVNPRFKHLYIYEA